MSPIMRNDMFELVKIMEQLDVMTKVSWNWLTYDHNVFNLANKPRVRVWKYNYPSKERIGLLRQL